MLTGNEVVQVKSTNIRAYQYLPESQILIVEFTTGKVYRYFDVPYATVEGLQSAKSKGGYFGANIRMSFHYERVGG